MKIFAANLMKMSPEQLKTLLEDPSQISSVLLEASRRGDANIFSIASELSYLTAEHINIILKFLIEQTGKKITPEKTEFIFYEILFRPEVIIRGAKPEYLMAIMTSNPRLAAIGLLSEGLGQDLVLRLIDIYELSFTDSAPYIVSPNKQKPSSMVLINMIDLMQKEKVVWRNKHSGFALTARLHYNSFDPFMTEAARHNLNFGMAQGLVYASNIYQFRENTQLTQNLKNNDNNSVKVSLSLLNEEANQQYLSEIIPRLTTLLERQELSPAEVWEVIQSRAGTGQWDVRDILEMPDNIILKLFRYDIETAKRIISDIEAYLRYGTAEYKNEGNVVIQTIVNSSLNNPSLREHALSSFDKNFFDSLPMTDSNRKIVEDHFKPIKPSQPIQTIENTDDDDYIPFSIKKTPTI